ncbi:DUF1700 domain-containing protein [Microbacterium gorillae]|uniref:hypothetical protein n=1 Tax=Microbacterium gorillae TaxID=1231063 RepID=UPI000590227D|nr:hypothetical protein [Microbacterium gorillae]
MTVTQSETTRYLEQLDIELRGLPPETAAEIRRGVAEELDGLDPDAAHERMITLGDPAFIAASARGELSDSADATPGRAPEGVASMGFAATAVIVMSLGGFVVPVLGWIVGVALVWASPRWRRAEKIVATAVPLGAGLLLKTIVPLLAGLFGTSTRYADDAARNPLLPTSYDVLWTAFLIGWIGLPIAAAAVGVYLVSRLRRSPGRSGIAGTRGFAITAAIVSGFGGFLVPVLGWFAGLALVWSARRFTRRTALIATLTPLAVCALWIVIGVVLGATAPVLIDDPGGGDFQVRNPMLAEPRLAQWGVTAVVWPVLPLAATVVGIWLLALALRTDPMEDPRA